MVVLLQTMQGIAQNDGGSQTESIAQSDSVLIEATRQPRCPGDCRLHLLVGAAAVTWAFYTTLQSPLIAAVISTVGMLVTGYRPALQLLTDRDRLRKN